MRASAFRSDKKFYHVALNFKASANLKILDWVFIQKTTVRVAQKFHIEIQSLLMMDTHVHLLVADLNNNENFFSQELQKALSGEALTENLSEPIIHYSQYLNTYKYIYRNPVEAGICKNVEDYEYSSLFYLLGNKKLYLNIVDHMNLIHNPIHVLRWLNNKENNYKNSKLSWQIEAT
jgi:putative transposase